MSWFDYPNTQLIADLLKRVMLAVPPASQRARNQRRVAMHALQTFEASQWHAGVMSAASNDTPGTFTPGAHAIDIQADDVDAAIIDLLDRYQQTMSALTGQPQRWLTIDEAAAFLDISPNSVRAMRYNEGRLHGQVRGDQLYFSEGELQRYQALRRKVGRPQRDTSGVQPS